MNVELLTKVMNKLKRMRHAEHFDMDTCIKKTDCGTAACIAGHTLLIAGFKPIYGTQRTAWIVKSPTSGRRVDGLNAAGKLLGLSKRQAGRLFITELWPSRFCFGDAEPHDPKIAAIRIRHFIDTKGKE